MYFESTEEVSQKVRRSYIWAEHPLDATKHNIYYVSTVDHDYITVTSIETSENWNINPTEINFLVPPLGYTKFGKEIVYLSRIPCRRWKQGLTMENISSPSLFSNYNHRQIIVGLRDIVEETHNIKQKDIIPLLEKNTPFILSSKMAYTNGQFKYQDIPIANFNNKTHNFTVLNKNYVKPLLKALTHRVPESTNYYIEEEKVPNYEEDDI